MFSLDSWSDFCFYCTFFQCNIFVFGYLLEYIVPILHKFGYKIEICKWNYRNETMFICVLISIFSILNLENRLDHIINVLFLSAIYVFVEQCMKYSKVDINSCQKDDVSIGAFWAQQAFEFYYKIVFESLHDRMASFERKHNVKFSLRKLILVAPLSCDISGTLDKKDDFIEYLGDLPIEECDQAANMNRMYKNPVYKIHQMNKDSLPMDNKYAISDGIHIVAEFPSPLGTLFKTKENFKKEVWNYHRKCFIKTLKNLTKNTPCIIVDYDENTPLSLSNILISAIIEERKVPQIMIE